MPKKNRSKNSYNLRFHHVPSFWGLPQDGAPVYVMWMLVNRFTPYEFDVSINQQVHSATCPCLNWTPKRSLTWAPSICWVSLGFVGSYIDFPLSCNEIDPAKVGLRWSWLHSMETCWWCWKAQQARRGCVAGHGLADGGMSVNEILNMKDGVFLGFSHMNNI
jgi:hypothetical protein